MFVNLGKGDYPECECNRSMTIAFCAFSLTEDVHTVRESPALLLFRSSTCLQTLTAKLGPRFAIKTLDCNEV
jgi:hypothetical protein